MIHEMLAVQGICYGRGYVLQVLKDYKRDAVDERDAEYKTDDIR